MRFLLSTSGCLLGLLGLTCYADDASLRQQLQSQWQQLGESIVTAEVHYTSGVFLLNLDSKSPALGVELTPQDVNALIDSLDLLNHPDNREKLTEKLYLQHDFRRSPWDEHCRILKKGQTLLCDNSRELHVLREASHVFQDKPNHQVNIQSRDRSSRGYDRIEDFYQLPQDIAGVCQLSALKEHAPEDQLELTYNDQGRELAAWVDRETGMPLHVLQSLNGTPVVEFRNMGVVMFPGGIPFPRLSVQALYRDGLLNRLTVRLVDDVRINQPLTDDQFDAPALPGDRVFDQRDSQHIHLSVDQPVADVLKYADLGIVQPEPKHVLPRIPVWSTVFFINGLAFLIFGLILWRRSRDPKQVVQR